MRIALVGTRGIPARYGGFETAVEEIGSRLVDRGHEIVVYCRSDGESGAPAVYRGMRLVHLPALRRKALETLSHTALTAAHMWWHRARFDAIVVFNAANAVFVPPLRRRGRGLATHVDGLEWKRAKWGRAGKRYYRVAEGLAARWSDALICDADGIARYYEDEFGVSGDVIAYGAPILDNVGQDRLHRLGLRPGRYHLVVARFEPENHVDLAIEGFSASNARDPLIVVGSAPYADEYSRVIESLASRDDRVRVIGPVWDQEQLNQLYAHARTYLHGHSVGGTNPSLLRAMGAGAAVLAYDVSFNREVLGTAEWLWSSASSLARAIDRFESDPGAELTVGRQLQARAAATYRWNDVAVEYEALCERLSAGESSTGIRPSLRRVLAR